MVQQISSKSICLSIFLAVLCMHSMFGAAAASSSSSSYAATSGSSSMTSSASHFNPMHSSEPSTFSSTDTLGISRPGIRYNSREWYTDFNTPQLSQAVPEKSTATRLGESLARFVQPITDQGAERITRVTDQIVADTENRVAHLLHSLEGNVTRTLNETGKNLVGVIRETGTSFTNGLPVVGETVTNIVQVTGAALEHQVLDGLGRNTQAVVAQTGHSLIDLTKEVGIGLKKQVLPAVKDTIAGVATDTIDSLGKNAESIIHGLGAEVHALTETFEQSAIRMANTITDATSESLHVAGHEFRRNARSFAKTLWQNLGLGAAAITGGVLAYKNLAKSYCEEVIDKKAAAFGALGVGIVAASLGIASWLFKKDQERDNDEAGAYRQMAVDQQNRKNEAIEELKVKQELAAALKSDREAITEEAMVDLALEAACREATKTLKIVDELFVSFTTHSDAKALDAIKAHLANAYARVKNAYEESIERLRLKSAHLSERRSLRCESIARSSSDSETRMRGIEDLFAAKEFLYEQARRLNHSAACQAIAHINEAWIRAQMMPAKSSTES